VFANTKAFSGFAVPNLEAAEKFYGDTLGIDISKGEMGDLVLNLTGGRDTFIYEKPDFVPATYTILNFVVDDVDQAVDRLTKKGVEFERYEGFDQDEKGIALGDQGPTIAWFKDPAGNILSVLEDR
jgi:predicted enzyme related to lactoylglutathione lyase